MGNDLSNVKRKNWEHYSLNEGEKISICKKCLTLSTRPRVVFDDRGVCNACNWLERKKTSVNWGERWKELSVLCDRFRCTDGTRWDCLVPCSGGKDGSYVAVRLRDDFDMHPLCVTLKPQMQTRIGKENLDNFIKSGFDHILISPNPLVYDSLARKGFIEQGRPKLPFVIGISLFTMKVAAKFNIPFIMYGEEGEEEYGGSVSQIGKFKIDRDFLVNYYFSGHDPVEYLDEFSKDDLKWWTLPSDKELDKAGLFPTHWSHFENWNPEAHYRVAKEQCGLCSVPGVSIGTFTNYAQLDDKLQDLHAFMMYVKFGFGRAWSDACIEVRAGRLSRDEGIELIKKYDGIFPWKYLSEYLDYFKMSEDEFWGVVDSFRSPDIWEKVDGEWRLKFEIK